MGILYFVNSELPTYEMKGNLSNKNSKYIWKNDRDATFNNQGRKF